MTDKQEVVNFSGGNSTLLSKADNSFLDRESGRIPDFKLVWNNLHYSVKMSDKQRNQLPDSASIKRKDILKGVSGYARSGQTLFIMGASGAGKTTLLNVLCDRIVKNANCQLTGDIKINGEIKVKQKTFGNYGAYVM